MCSIAGATKKEEVEKMLKLMKHRAPDDEGIVENGIFLGMGRLAIIDLESKGLCPIEDDGMTLVFNGELYNYLEIREELKNLGYEFKTNCDSEVLLKAYEEWGKECLNKFNFMGAFAISDSSTIFLARDIAGEKPLYFRLNPFAFASEAKVFKSNCQELPNAHYAIYDIETETIQLYKWWEYPEEGTYQGTFEEAVTELDRLLSDSVKLRTKADVLYGLNFSSGIDSTLISTYHDFEYKFPYIDDDYEHEFKRVFPKILWHLDYPVKHFSAFGLWKLAEQASKKVKVTLGGEGADELFGGYVRYVSNEFNRLAQIEFPSYTAMFPYRNMMKEEFYGNMQEELRMRDRMSSAFGLEHRTPFFDRRIIEFAISLPMKWKIDGFQTKVILRELLKRRKPDYQFEEKKGLFCSVNSWLGESNLFDKKTYLAYQEKLWRKPLK